MTDILLLDYCYVAQQLHNMLQSHTPLFNEMQENISCDG